MKLSVVLIVKNEHDCLDKCLSSVVGADEIIVCDTGSSDDTVEIAKKYTDKVFTDYKWNDSMCEARNHALSKATGDWVLSIDADEYLEEGSIEKIRKIIDGAKKELTFDVKMTDGNNGSEFDFPRLFRRHSKVKWCGAIHNYLSVAEDNETDIRITFGYSKAHALDPDRALRILQKEVDKNPKAPRETFYLAREYFYRNDWTNAIKYYERYVNGLAWWGPEWAEGYYMLALCYRNAGNGDKARDMCLQALKINANMRNAIRLLAELSGPGNRKRWLEFYGTANDDGVLFPRRVIKANIEVCLIVYKRKDRLDEIKEDLRKQTLQQFKLNVLDNTIDNKGSVARFDLARSTKGDIVIFIDDDFKLEPDFVEHAYLMYEQYGENCILGGWNRKFNKEEYWDCKRNIEGEVDYVGTGGMILNRKIIDEMGEVPGEFKKVEDLYLSFLARQRGMKLIGIEQRFTIEDDGQDQYKTLLDYKQNAFQSLRKQGWKLLKDNAHL